MTRWDGRHGKGARKALREAKSLEGELRTEDTSEHRRKAFRLGPVPDGGRTAFSIRKYRTAFLADNGNTPENVAKIADVLIVATSEEYHASAAESLDKLGLTYAELEEQAHQGNFNSAHAQSLWVSIGDTIDPELLPKEAA